MDNSQIEIVLAEDNLDDAELTIHALRKGMIANKLIHLKDGVEVLDFLFGTGQFAGRDMSQKPKLILLDLKMPKINGMEVLEKVKTNETTKSIPVVVLTSSRENPDLEKCYALGANSYIVKPVNFDGLVKVVQELGMYWVILNQVPS